MNTQNGYTAVITLALSFVLTAILFILFFIFKGNRREIILDILVLSCSILSATVMFSLYEKSVYEPSQSFIGENISISGTVTSAPQVNSSGGFYFEVRTDTIGDTKAHQKIRILTYDDEDLLPGDTVSLQAEKIYSISDDSVNNKSKGIYLGAYVKSGGIEFTPYTGFSASRLVNAFRQSIKNYFSQHTSKDISAILSAMLTNDRNEMSDATYSSLLEAGVTHLLVVSGMHISFWSTVAYSLLSAIRIRKKIRIPICLAVVVFTVALTGFSASALRAGIMMTVLFSAEFFNNDSDPLNSLGLALTAFCLINPYSPGSFSLALSAGTTAGIIVLEPVCRSFIRNKTSKLTHPKVKFILRAVLYMLGVSFCASVAAIPLSALFFGYTSICSPIMSILLAPITECTMIFAGLSALLSPITVLANPLIFTAGVLAKIIKSLCSLTNLLPITILSIRQPLFIVLTALCFGLLVMLALFPKARKASIPVAVLCCSTVISIICYSVISYNSVKIIIPDTGNSTCVILSDHGHTSVIGCGDDMYLPSIRDALVETGKMNAERLIIPRDKSTENGGMTEIYDSFRNCDSVMYSYDGENAVMDYQYETRNCSVHILTTENFSGGVITCGEKKVLMVFYPGADMTALPEEFYDANILISRAAMPFELDEQDFEAVYIMKSDNDSRVLRLQ